MPELWIYRGCSDLGFLDDDVGHLEKVAHNLTIRRVFALHQLRPERLTKLTDGLEDFIVDPCSYARYEKRSRKKPRPKAMRIDYAYLYGANQERLETSAVAKYLDNVKADKASAVICPCLIKLESSNWEKALRAIAQNLEILRDNTPDANVILEVLIDEDLMGERAIMDEVISWLLPQEIGGLAARIQWSSPDSYTELDDERTLRACISLIEACNDAHVPLYFPNTGLTGLFLVAHGATGFGTGLSDPFQAWREKPFFKSTKGRSAKRKRWFSVPLLSWIDLEVHQALNTFRDYRGCRLPCCKDGNLTRAERHYIWALAALASRVVSADSPLAELRKRTDSAVSLWKRLNRTVSSKTLMPDHLVTWNRILPKLTENDLRDE